MPVVVGCSDTVTHLCSGPYLPNVSFWVSRDAQQQSVCMSCKTVFFFLVALQDRDPVECGSIGGGLHLDAGM